MNWHVAVTDTRHEQQACQDIRATGFDAFTPIERHKRYRHGHKVIIERALFPRYIFASFDASDPCWGVILEVDGVCDILCNQGQPSPVPEPIIPKLKRMQQLGLFDYTKAPNPFPPGSKVMLDDDGPFAELIAKVLRVRTADRVDVLLTYLGRQLTVNLSMARLCHV